jgi:hypothetical protein
MYRPDCEKELHDAQALDVARALEAAKSVAMEVKVKCIMIDT